MKKTFALIVLAFALQHVSDAQSHEFWIEPNGFRPQVGSVLRIGLWVGDRFAGEAYPYDPDRIDRFTLVGAATEKPVIGKSGVAISLVKIDAAGLHRIGYRSKRARNQLSAVEFERYLKEEGLEQIIQRRAERGESDQVGLEVYSRCAKALVCAGGECATDSDAPLGCPLEIVAVQNPYQLKAGDDLRVRVLYDGNPLRAARVVAVNKRDPDKLSFAISDSRGEAVFGLREPGEWLITTIQMIRAPESVDADWESFWASLTFELPRSP